MPFTGPRIIHQPGSETIRTRENLCLASWHRGEKRWEHEPDLPFCAERFIPPDKGVFHLPGYNAVRAEVDRIIRENPHTDGDVLAAMLSEICKDVGEWPR